MRRRSTTSGGGRRDLGTWFFIILFPAIFVTGGGLCVYHGGRQAIDSINSPSWPRVDGKLVYAGQRSQSVDVRIVYDYKVGDRYYRSYRHSFGSSYARPGEWTVGKTVTVFYDPRDPSSSVISPGPEIGPFALTIFGLFAIAAGLGIGVFVFRAAE